MITADERGCALSLLDGVGIEYRCNAQGHKEMVEDVLDLMEEEGDEVGERSDPSSVRHFVELVCLLKVHAIAARLSGEINKALEYERDIDSVSDATDDEVAYVLLKHEELMYRWRIENVDNPMHR